MRFCLVDTNGNVVGAVELDASWQKPGTLLSWTVPDGLTVVQSDVAGQGWTYVAGVFTPPPTPAPPAPTQDQLRAASFVATPDRQDLVSRLQTATPAKIDSWLATNVTTLAQARTVLGAVIKVLATQQLT